MSGRWDAERELDRRRGELLAQAALHRARCADRIAAAAVAASRDHPLLYLLAGVGVGAAVVAAAPASARALCAASGAATRIAGAGVRFVADTLASIANHGGGGVAIS